MWVFITQPTTLMDYTAFFHIIFVRHCLGSLRFLHSSSQGDRLATSLLACGSPRWKPVSQMWISSDNLWGSLSFQFRTETHSFTQLKSPKSHLLCVFMKRHGVENKHQKMIWWTDTGWGQLQTFKTTETISWTMDSWKNRMWSEWRGCFKAAGIFIVWLCCFCLNDLIHPSVDPRCSHTCCVWSASRGFRRQQEVQTSTVTSSPAWVWTCFKRGSSSWNNTHTHMIPAA